MLIFRFLKAVFMFYCMVVAIHYSWIAAGIFWALGMYDGYKFLQETEKLCKEVSQNG